MKNNWAALILVSCLASIAAPAQNHFQYFSQLTTQSGLANNIVNDIIQDEAGYLWIASWGGLQRYDGKGYITFKASLTDTTTLPSDIVQRLLLDKKDLLWVVTAKGICLYNKSKRAFQRIRMSTDAFPWNMVASFFQDADGVVWLSDSKKGLYFCESPEKGFLPYYEKWPAFEGDLTCVQEDSEQKGFWLGTSKGVFFLDKGTQRYQSLADRAAIKKGNGSVSHSVIQNIRLDKKNGLLWVLEGGRAFRYQVNSMTGQEVRGQPEKGLHTILPDKFNGKVWAIGSRVFQYDAAENRWKEYVDFNDSKFSLPGQQYQLRCAFEDRDGAIWVGSNNGIFVFMPGVDKFKYYSIPTAPYNCQPLDSVSRLRTSILELVDSITLVTMSSQCSRGLALFDSKMRKINIPEPLASIYRSSRTPMQFFEDSHKLLWYTGPPGKVGQLNLKDHTKKEFITPELANSQVTSVAEDEQGNLLWATNKSTLVTWSRAENRFEQTLNLKFFKDFAGGLIVKLFFDRKQDCIWVVTENQIVRIQENSEATFYQADRPIDINEVKEWNEDYFMVGSAQGLFLFSKKMPGKFEVFVVDGHPFEFHITSLTKDKLNNIWVGTQGNGLFKVLNTRNKAIEFGGNDGAIFSSSYSGMVQLSNGLIVTGIPEGLLVLDPAIANNSLSNPRVSITSMTVNDAEVNLDSVWFGPLHLGWNENSIGIEFSSLSYYYNGKVNYQYRLENIDTKWGFSKGAEKIKYTELPPGEYTFRVRSQPLASQVISDEAVLTFTIATPFWDTWLFRISVVVFISLVAFYIYYAKIQRVLLIQRIRNRISRDLHDHIGSSLSSISILLRVVSASVTSGSAADLLKKISETAHLTQENLHDIVWSINSKNSSMEQIISRMQEFMYSIFEGQDVKLTFQSSESMINEDLRLDKRYDLYLIFKEIVNNGAKYASASRIDISLKRAHGQVELIYEDDGNGFDPSTQSDGNGILNMKQRATSLGGTLQLQSEVGRGTRIVVRFPVK